MEEKWVGRTLSKVTLHGLIGRGGMAEVYRGRHNTLDRPVAVKILHAHLAQDERLFRRTQAEARAVAQLRHPNIVQVYDFDIVDGRPYIVMELLEGISLGDYLKAHHAAGYSLPLPLISRLVHGIARALDYAHQKGIVHRDVKPANVMLRRGETPLRADLPLPSDAEPVLTDFGVARIAHATTHTVEGTVLGTPHYMSPEQIQGEAVNATTDIYALGIIAYEMLTGSVPFDTETDTPASILYKQIHELPPPMPDTSERLQGAVFRALAKDKLARFQSAGAFAQALAPLSSRPAPSAPTLAAEPTPREVRLSETHTQSLLTGLRDRVRPFWLVFSAAALILALTGGIMLRNLQSPASPSPQPTTRALTTEKTSPTDAPAVQPTAASPTQPAQTALLEGSLLSVAGELELQLRGLDSPGETALYRAILTAPDREALVIGDLAIYNGEAAVAFVHPQGTNILGNYNHLLITYHESPDSDSSDIILDLEFDPAVVDRFRLLEEVSGGADPLKSIASGLTLQAGHYESHRSFTLSSISAGDLAGARSHAEHIINILSGRSGEAYGDWNDNQRTENPGDDVGLQVYMGLLGDLSAGALAGEAEAALQAQELIRALDELQGVIAEALKIAQQVALADSLDVITEFGIADQLDALQVQSQVDAVLGMSQELTLAYQIHFER